MNTFSKAVKVQLASANSALAIPDELFRDKYDENLRRLHRFTRDDGGTLLFSKISSGLYRKLVKINDDDRNDYGNENENIKKSNDDDDADDSNRTCSDGSKINSRNNNNNDDETNNESNGNKDMRDDEREPDTLLTRKLKAEEMERISADPSVWRYTGVEGYVLVPRTGDAPPEGCIPVFQRVLEDGRGELSLGEVVKKKIPTGSADAKHNNDHNNSDKNKNNDNINGGNDQNGAVVVKSDPELGRLLGYIPVTRDERYLANYSDLREYREVDTGVLFYTTRPDEWEFFSQLDKNRSSNSSSSSSNYNSTPGGGGGASSSPSKPSRIHPLIGSDNNDNGNNNNANHKNNGSKFKPPPPLVVDHRTGELSPRSPVFSSSSLAANPPPRWVLTRSLGYISVEERHDIALVLSDSRKESDGKATNNSNNDNGNDNGNNGQPPPVKPNPKRNEKNASDSGERKRDRPGSARVNASSYESEFTVQRSEMIRAIALSGFAVRIAYSSDGQDTHVLITLPPRILEFVLQDMRVSIYQGKGFGFAPFSFKHRADFAGYQGCDKDIPFQIAQPAVRMRAVEFALERRVFPFGFIHNVSWIGGSSSSLESFYPLESAKDTDEPVEERGRPGKNIAVEDRDLLSFEACKTNGIITEVVYLHDLPTRNRLIDTWAKAFTKPQPLAEVRSYFGGRIAFYFAWLGYYNMWLVAPSIAGAAVFIQQLAEGKIEVSLLPFFCAFMAIWAVLFLEGWVRKQNTLAHEWGLLQFTQSERERIEFKGERREHALVKGHFYLYYPRWKRSVKYALGLPVLTLFVGVVIAFIIAMIEFKAARSFSCGGVSGCEGYIASLATSIFVIVMNTVYTYVSQWLTDWENHKTDTAYENMLIIKTFAFQFANSFAALFHLAFWELDLDTLRLQLFMNLFVKQIAMNIKELLIPYLLYRRAKMAERREIEAAGVGARLTQLEKDVLKPAAGASSYNSFSEILMQYAYVTLFVPVLPIAPLAALINNIIEVRVDAYQTCAQNRRSSGKDAAGIGTWMLILRAVSAIAVITNSVLLSMPDDSLSDFNSGDQLTSQERVWVLFLFEHFIFILQIAVIKIVPDMPSRVSSETAQQKVAQRARDEADLEADGLRFGDAPDSDSEEEDPQVEVPRYMGGKEVLRHASKAQMELLKRHGVDVDKIML